MPMQSIGYGAATRRAGWGSRSPPDRFAVDLPFLRGGEERLPSTLRTVCCGTGIAGTVHTLAAFAALDPRRRAAAPLPGRTVSGPTILCRDARESGMMAGGIGFLRTNHGALDRG